MNDRLQNLRHIENLISSDIDATMRNLLQERLYMNKKAIINEIHKNKISLCKDGRLRTYVGIGKARKELRAATEKELFEKLWEYYHLGGVTFEELFREWLSYKEALSTSISTVVRHKQRYEKYLSNSTLLSMNIAEITRLALEKEFTRIIKESNLTRKEWINLSCIPNGMFRLALDKGYITSNPMDSLSLTCRFRQATRKSSSEKIFTTEEYTELHEFLQTDYNETHRLSCLAARFQLYSGLRFGELSALAWDDIDFTARTLHIYRSRTENKITGEYELHSHTKTHYDRTISLVPQALEVLSQIPRNGEFIFSSGSSFLTSRALNWALEKAAKHLGFSHEKRSHACRRTYASRLASAGVELETLRNDLGHSVLSTTLSYIYEYDPHASYEKKCAAL